MDAYNAMFSATYVLNEEIAREVFSALPDGAPVLAIVDCGGNCWASDPGEFARLHLAETFLDDLRAQVDDGVEPAIVQVGDTSVMMTQLATEHTKCGYLIVTLPRHDTDVTQGNLDLADALFSQITLVAKLVEKHSLLGDMQVKCYGAYGTSSAPAN